MAQHQRKHHRRHKRFRFGKLYGAICVLLILLAIVGGSVVFFRVDEVVVEGNGRYSTQQIIDITGIERGDNMFLINKFDIIDTLEGELPYLDTVVIRRNLPSTIRITVTECDVAAAVRDEGTGQWWLVSAAGKLLQQANSPGNHLAVTGLTFVETKAGVDLAVAEEQRLHLTALTQLLTALERRGLIAGADGLDLSAAGTVTLHYAERLEMKMKLSTDFDYQVRVLAKVMNEYVLPKWDAEDTGILDMTRADGLPHLVKNMAEN